MKLLRLLPALAFDLAATLAVLAWGARATDASNSIYAAAPDVETARQPGKSRVFGQNWMLRPNVCWAAASNSAGWLKPG